NLLCVFFPHSLPKPGLKVVASRVQSRDHISALLGQAPVGKQVSSQLNMAFLLDYFAYQWEKQNNDADSYKEWSEFLDVAEKDRRRDRIIAWRERVMYDDYAVNAEEPIVYKRTAGFVWREVDHTGTHKNRNHTYMYNLKSFGHKMYSRRDTAELTAAEKAVAERVRKGELGGLSPLA
ncbi:hypothetical protein Agub_g14082, partial [Astrephomene gubernaculifera]